MHQSVVITAILSVLFNIMLTDTVHAQSALDLHNPIPGGSVVVLLGTVDAPQPVVKFGKRRILVKRHQNQWVALLGLPLDTVPGRYIVLINQSDNESNIRDFIVKPHRYSVNRVVAQTRRRETSGSKVQSALSKYKQTLVKMASLWSEELAADLPLMPPVDGTQIGEYGSRQVKGDVITTPMDYVEFLAKPSAVVRAPGAGRVHALLSVDDAGVALCIDHGMGLLSFIGPIAHADVKEGAHVAKGAALGMLANDLSIPAHVNWYVALNQEFINPMFLIQQH